MRAGPPPVVAVALAAAVLVAGCAPAVSTMPRIPDDDLETKETAAPAPPAAAEPRAVAPPGKGIRTGAIGRARLLAVLDAGPGAFLRQLEVTPRRSGDQFIGWQLVQLLDPTGPLAAVDVVPGDVLLTINGKPLSRPEQLQTVWDALRTANALDAELWRGDTKLELHFTIEPPVR